MTPMSNPSTRLLFDNVEVGDELPTLTNPPITHVQLVRYAGASGDFNPLHTNPEIGKSIGIGGTIAHGMLIMGFLGHLVSDYLGGPALLSNFKVRFANMSRPGEILICSGKVTRKYEEGDKGFIEAEVRATNPEGQVKATGTFTACIPKK
ncbi:MAG: dehydratase [Chloroflexi bacterium]|nr:dehydratase [Chloroflexota bacterium]